MVFLIVKSENFSHNKTYSYDIQTPTESSFKISSITPEFICFQDEYIELPSKTIPNSIFLSLIPYNESKINHKNLFIKGDLEFVNDSILETLRHYNYARIFKFRNRNEATNAISLFSNYSISQEVSFEEIDETLSSNYLDEWGWFYYKLYDELTSLGHDIENDVNFLSSFIEYKLSFIAKLKDDKNLINNIYWFERRNIQEKKRNKFDNTITGYVHLTPEHKHTLQASPHTEQGKSRIIHVPFFINACLVIFSFILIYYFSAYILSVMLP